MAKRRTQKQISERYKDNLADYKRLYTWRRAGVAVTLLTLLGGAMAIWWYYKQAPDKFFNPGPVSSHHLNITPAMMSPKSQNAGNSQKLNNCDACHDKSLVAGNGLTARKFTHVLRDSFRKGV